MSGRGEYDEETFDRQRHRMVDEQIARRGVRDPAVLAAMRTVPRHLFVPTAQIGDAYNDCPLPVGFDQTISQPYIVGSMTENLKASAGSRILEIGTGSGYQTAVLAEMVDEVFTMEVVPELYERASELLEQLKYCNVRLRFGDGSHGWVEHSPYDGIIVTAVAPHLPDELVAQLSPGGRLVVPLVGTDGNRQELWVIIKTPDGIEKEYLYDVRFVPMRGDIER